ncbi:hypothetical protein KFL_000580290 [Klebsormidium nitens]|uniref:Growth-regulating factor n=1 Tax=Klebsormidium nitens TaxID=105231 RepID=A0A1Y1HPS1_KLENI|nr:hypothetical protein KFL_000580290 [Klebsormidium nitens]|eukprot:GAQ80634.1 hypothetical protein KFL_000580290 [Klebsormidium nitens]
MPLVYEGGGFGALGNDVTDAAGLLQGLRATEDAFAAQPGLLGGLPNVFEDEDDFDKAKAPETGMRCSRQNGLGWQCANPAVPARRYCEKHLMRKPKKKRVKVVSAEVVQTDSQDTDGKGRAKPGMCHRTNGQGWWCKRAAVPGTTFCQNHLDRIRKQRENRAARENGKGKSSPAEASNQAEGWSQGGLEKFPEEREDDSDEDKPLWELPGLRSGAPSLMQVAEAGLDEEDRAGGDWRCKRSDGRNWQCSKERQMGRPYCREHTELDRKKREAAKKTVKERKRQKKEEKERGAEPAAQQGPPLSDSGGSATELLFMPSAPQQRQGVEAVMSAAELFMPQGGGFPEQLIRYAPAGLQAAGMPLPNRSAFTPVASHGSAFTPVASHSFGGHAFMPVSRVNKSFPQQSGFGLYNEGSFGAGSFGGTLLGGVALGGGSYRDENVHNAALNGGSYRDENVHNAFDLNQVQEPVRICQLGDGKGWTCALRAAEGQSFCEKHCEQLLRRSGQVVQEDLAQQILAEHQERERRAYAMMEDVQQELLMQGEIPTSLYGNDGQRFGSILSI